MLKFILRLFRIRPSMAEAEPPPPATRPTGTSPAPKPSGKGLLRTDTQTIRGKCYVIDGDTIVIRGTHIRLAGIDAPELDQPWGKKAKFAMISLCRGQEITAEVDLRQSLTYDRVVAKCLLPDGTDLAAALVGQGLALDWAKFSGGAYRSMEPPGIRRKLWRVAAKHQGRLPMTAS